jgi:hypothetical protein
MRTSAGAFSVFLNSKSAFLNNFVDRIYRVLLTFNDEDELSRVDLSSMTGEYVKIIYVLTDVITT